MRSVIVFAVLMLAAGVIVPRYASQMTTATKPAALAVQPDRDASAAAAARSLTVTRDARGHFRVAGRIDGRAVNFVVDTGASVIALTAGDAGRLGIHPARRDFTVEVSTANGTVRAAPMRLDLVEAGDLSMHDVAAVIMPDGALGEDLLGMSFLSRLRHFEYSGGQLVLEQ